MPRFIALFTAFLLTACTAEDPHAMDTDVWLKFDSAASAQETMDRFEAAVRARGLTVFTRIDHAANAEGAGLELEPNQVLIFGNPKAGTQLMQADAHIGLDLPMRALVHGRPDGSSMILMHDPAAVAMRYGIRTLDPLLGKMRDTLNALGKAASSG